MRPDIRSLIHGIFNLILPFFAYDLAGLLSFALTVGDYTPWTAIWPMTILVALPFLSDLVGVVLGAVRYAENGPHLRAAGHHLLRRRRGAVLHAPLPAGLHPVRHAGVIFLIF